VQDGASLTSLHRSELKREGYLCGTLKLHTPAPLVPIKICTFSWVLKVLKQKLERQLPPSAPSATLVFVPTSRLKVPSKSHPIAHRTPSIELLATRHVREIEQKKDCKMNVMNEKVRVSWRHTAGNFQQVRS
jgi:hypothetical protein